MSGTETGQQYGDLIVGARGYLHSHWQDVFYPDDIPEEWRLGFFANEFNALLVPWSQWHELDETDLPDVSHSNGPDRVESTARNHLL